MPAAAEAEILFPVLRALLAGALRNDTLHNNSPLLSSLFPLKTHLRDPRVLRKKREGLPSGMGVGGEGTCNTLNNRKKEEAALASFLKKRRGRNQICVFFPNSPHSRDHRAHMTILTFLVLTPLSILLSCPLLWGLGAPFTVPVLCIPIAKAVCHLPFC